MFYPSTGEEEITFPPTYRIKKGTRDEYVFEKVKSSGVSCSKLCVSHAAVPSPLRVLQIKINNPSWCDRVLWRSYPELYVSSQAYGNPLKIPLLHSKLHIRTTFSGSCENITTSDHKPVFACFKVGLNDQGVTSTVRGSQLDHGVEVVFGRMNAKLQMTNIHELLTVEIHSAMLESAKIQHQRDNHS